MTRIVKACGRGGKKVNMTCISPVRSLLMPASVVAEDNSFTSGSSHESPSWHPSQQNILLVCECPGAFTCWPGCQEINTALLDFTQNHVVCTQA